jgi:hypothetical protein
LDAELGLPSRCYSDLLRDWAEYCATDEAYDESIRVLERILGLVISKLALETTVQEDAVDVDAFYEQKPVPLSGDEGSILVVQADGKGVPMKRDEAAAKSARRGKGQKRTKKKEAIVTAIYTVEPHKRTPQDIVEALLPELVEDTGNQQASTSQPERPVPVGKEVRATLDGKDVAFQHLTQRVAHRDGTHVRQRVALTDGDESLQDRVREQLPQFTLILDIIHASEYLWNAANALMGETHPDRNAWVGEQLLQILSDQTRTVIRTLDTLAQDPSRSSAQRQAFDQYLTQGWPIGTGVIEGACGHLVKDRMELPVGVIENEPKIDMAANLGLGGESVWLPSIFVTDLRVRWEAIDDTTARLVVPFGEKEDTFTVTFDPETGLITTLEAKRYREATDEAKILWHNTMMDWQKVNGHLLPLVGAVTWMDEGTPWAVFTVEEVVYNEVIVALENVDAIHALAGTVEDGRESMRITDEAVGIRQDSLVW